MRHPEFLKGWRAARHAFFAELVNPHPEAHSAALSAAEYAEDQGHFLLEILTEYRLALATKIDESLRLNRERK